MLTAEFLDSLPDQIVSLYTEYETSIILDIVRRIAKLDFATSTAAWQVQRLTESGKLYTQILEELSKLTGKSEIELRRIFKNAGVKALKFDDAIYLKAGLAPLPLNLSPEMSEVLAAGLRKTGNIMRNLTMTTALSGQEAFINATDLAYMQISSGSLDYDSAIRQAVKKVAYDGVSVINYASGAHDQLDVATRRTVLTGVSQTTGELQIKRADEMGSDLVQTSAHIGARPTHEVWQGQVFSRSGTNPKYPDFVESTGYGTGPGLGGWNCRHSFFPFFEGISEPAYTNATLDDYEHKTVLYNGIEMSVYEATQYQRGIERKIRYWKRQTAVVNLTKQDNLEETQKVKHYQARMRDFIRQTKLDRQPVRELI